MSGIAGRFSRAPGARSGGISSGVTIAWAGAVGVGAGASSGAAWSVNATVGVLAIHMPQSKASTSPPPSSARCRPRREVAGGVTLLMLAAATRP